jgi:DSF synthase
MGAYTLLRRRISAREAKDVITGGGTWLAEDLHRLGVVDHLCEQGEGEVFVTKMLYRHSRKPGLTRFLRAASRLSGSELDEMRRITNEWVSAALDLSEECLVRMDKIVAYQHRVNLEAARGPIVTIKRIGEPAGMP